MADEASGDGGRWPMMLRGMVADGRRGFGGWWPMADEASGDGGRWPMRLRGMVANEVVRSSVCRVLRFTTRQNLASTEWHMATTCRYTCLYTGLYPFLRRHMSTHMSMPHFRYPFLDAFLFCHISILGPFLYPTFLFWATYLCHISILGRRTVPTYLFWAGRKWGWGTRCVNDFSVCVRGQLAP